MYFLRKAILPIEMELNEQKGDNSQSEKDDNEDIECYVKDNLFQKAKGNIVDVQIRQKSDYDMANMARKRYIVGSVLTCKELTV